MHMKVIVPILAAMPTHTVYFVLHHDHRLLFTTVYLINGVASMAY